jgi:hypothetical protein
LGKVFFSDGESRNNLIFRGIQRGKPDSGWVFKMAGCKLGTVSWHEVRA